MHQTHLAQVDLNLLVALDVLLDEGSVTRAAERLHLSQPAMSRTLGRLRDLFADPLFVREGRVMVPSQRARHLREPVKLALSGVKDLLDPPAPFDPAATARTFRLWTPDYAQVALLGPVLDELVAAAPGVTVVLLPLGVDPVSALASGAADLVFGPPSVSPPWCVCQPFLSDPWVVVCREDLPPPESLPSYLAAHHLAVGMEQGHGSPIDLALTRDGHRRDVRLRVPDFAGALFVAATSRLVATLPRPIGEQGARLLPLTLAPLPFAAPEPTIAMIWPHRLTGDPAHRWLRELVLSRVGAGTLSPDRRAELSHSQARTAA